MVDTPISLVDCHPTVLEALGCPRDASDSALPGESLWAIAAAESRDRTVFSEYHAIGSPSAYYMLRDRRYKYIYHVAGAAQLFDLAADPDEVDDLARQPDERARRLLGEFEAKLREILDPEAVDRRAKADQQRKIESLGGREAVVKRGAFVNSPVARRNAALPGAAVGRLSRPGSSLAPGKKKPARRLVPDFVPGEIRTPDTWFRRPVLYPLSYRHFYTTQLSPCAAENQEPIDRGRGQARLVAFARISAQPYN